MENITQEPYQDSPASSRSSTPTPSSRASTAKPLPSLPRQPASQPLEPYRDDPSDSGHDEHDSDSPTIASPSPQRYHRSASDGPPAQTQVFTPYTDNVFDDDDVPLAHLYPYPTEAPPSYYVAVRESYRATLIQHIPSHSISTDADEEAGVDHPQADDVRFTVERVVAAIIVSMMLLLIAALLALFALWSFHASRG
ncbi:hypothetical protein K458DRAFT_431876 [Lentithecium fluviatile CBS 122367]|uniref:Uncharacterized protein n=1 Tax=Lentithecium fluviatile CBS 122367 TaxID=1168545 RepID=A0A6G1IZU0_9PLEO|nr:hypothetical protein K458DRAFT_431876 [Lentithecium fluviatile CBS 122367]